MAEFQAEGLSQLFLLFSASGKKKTRNRAHERLNLTLPSFLGVCDPVSSQSHQCHEVFITSFTVIMGQTGRIQQLVFFYLNLRKCPIIFILSNSKNLTC